MFLCEHGSTFLCIQSSPLCSFNKKAPHPDTTDAGLDQLFMVDQWQARERGAMQRTKQNALNYILFFLSWIFPQQSTTLRS